MTSPYQAADGRWIYFDGTTKRFFDTQQEAWIMAQKATFLTAVSSTITQIAQGADNAQQQLATYWARGYNVGGTLELSADDLSAFGLTRGQLDAYLTFAEQLNKLLDNQATTPNNYRQTLDALRTDV